MAFSTRVTLLAMGVTFLVALASSAPSNSSSSSPASSKRPAPVANRGDSGAEIKSPTTATGPKTLSSFAKAPAPSTVRGSPVDPASTGLARSPTGKNSTRIARDTFQTDKIPAKPSGSDKQRVPSPGAPKPQSHSQNSPSPVRRSPLGNATTGRNSSRNARSATEEEESKDDSNPSSGKSNSEGPAIPSTHPLFAQRQTSNITESLRPKLRAPGSSSSTTDIKKSHSSADEASEAEESESDEEAKEKMKKPYLKSSVNKSTSSEESSDSVISSTGSVSVSDKGIFSRPLSGLASGTDSISGGSKRVGTSSKHAPAKGEDADTFF